jgi:hypothetical protein
MLVINLLLKVDILHLFLVKFDVFISFLQGINGVSIKYEILIKLLVRCNLA